MIIFDSTTAHWIQRQLPVRKGWFHMVKFVKTAPDEWGGPAFAVCIIEDVLSIFSYKLFIKMEESL